MSTGRPPDLVGRRVLDATPCWRNTLPKYLALVAAGADLTIGVDPGIPHDEATVALVQSIGLPLDDAAATDYDVVLDCAGRYRDRPGRYGSVELTRSGAEPYADATVPVVLVDASRTQAGRGSSGHQRRFPARTGPSERPYRRTGSTGIRRGQGGSGICWRSISVGANVTMVDTRAVEMPAGVRVVRFDDTARVRDLIATTDLIVTATGVSSAVADFSIDLIASGARPTNMGATDGYGPRVPSSRVLNAKSPLNFVLSEPTRLHYLESSMALSNAAADWLIGRAARDSLSGREFSRQIPSWKCPSWWQRCPGYPPRAWRHRSVNMTSQRHRNYPWREEGSCSRTGWAVAAHPPVGCRQRRPSPPGTNCPQA